MTFPCLDRHKDKVVYSTSIKTGQVSDSFDTIAANKNIQLVLNLCPQEIFIHADPELLKQVLDTIPSPKIR